MAFRFACQRAQGDQLDQTKGLSGCHILFPTVAKLIPLGNPQAGRGCTVYSFPVVIPQQLVFRNNIVASPFRGSLLRIALKTSGHAPFTLLSAIYMCHSILSKCLSLCLVTQHQYPNWSSTLLKEVMSKVNLQICRKPLKAHRGHCLRDALIRCPSESSDEKDPLSQQLILDLVLSFSFNARQGFKSNWSILLALFFLPPNITCCQEKQPLIGKVN